MKEGYHCHPASWSTLCSQRCLKIFIFQKLKFGPNQERHSQSATTLSQGILKGKDHCTFHLLFDRFELVCFANKNKNYQLSYSWFQTSQTGGKWYNDTSPFSIPWLSIMTLSIIIINYKHLRPIDHGHHCWLESLFSVVS